MTVSFWLRSMSIGLGWLAIILVFCSTNAPDPAAAHRYGMVCVAFAGLLVLLAIAFDLARIAERKP